MMKFNQRNMTGILTTTLWLGAGVYTILYGATQTWSAIGYLVVAVGVLRGALLIRDWNRAK